MKFPFLKDFLRPLKVPLSTKSPANLEKNWFESLTYPLAFLYSLIISVEMHRLYPDQVF